MIRDGVMAAVARLQRGMKIAAGARFVRGRAVVTVLEAGDAITWRDDLTGEHFEGRVADFEGLALRRLRPVVDAGVAGDLLGIAWDLASTTTMPHLERYQLLADLYGEVMLGRSGTEGERAALLRWLSALRLGVEPERDAPAASTAPAGAGG